MKAFLIFLVPIAGFCSIGLANFQTPTNDTNTKITAYDEGCSVIKATAAYYTEFGDNGGAGKALVVKATIQNLSYNKSVILKHANGQSGQAQNTDIYWQVATAISYDSQSDNGQVDNVTIIDRNVAMELSDTITLEVLMNGTNFNCTFNVGQ